MKPVNVLVVRCIDSASEDEFEVYLKTDNLQQQHPEFLRLLTSDGTHDDDDDDDDNVIVDFTFTPWSTRPENLDDDTINKYIQVLIGNYTEDDCRYNASVDGSVIDIAFGPTVIY